MKGNFLNEFYGVTRGFGDSISKPMLGFLRPKLLEWTPTWYLHFQEVSQSYFNSSLTIRFCLNHSQVIG